MVHHATFSFKKHITPALCVLALCAAIGCAKKEPVSVVPAPSTATHTASASPACEPDRNTLYDQGVCAYDEGKLRYAMALWREAYTVETDHAVRLRSQFALGAVRLAQAANDTEYAAALDLLDAWAKASPPGGSGENPRFLLPALHTLRPASALKEQKTALDKECAKKLAEREAQVRKSIQQQVRALETIHQQIQEKKKGLSNF
ncbi:conserved hypothetical protein [Solidesulfovibrio fructosivorans JJ]]|uniref:Uncharacterized protein n=2 Tax=Solidesulfovibrio fructosivorans TaxID=878 RepID=E1JUW6_SOLFR|nr:conserved hypothetical protein [Solidesulfovibrio fructosivorans JJ]]